MKKFALFALFTITSFLSAEEFFPYEDYDDPYEDAIIAERYPCDQIEAENSRDLNININSYWLDLADKFKTNGYTWYCPCGRLMKNKPYKWEEYKWRKNRSSEREQDSKQ